MTREEWEKYYAQLELVSSSLGHLISRIRKLEEVAEAARMVENFYGSSVMDVPKLIERLAEKLAVLDQE